MRTVTSENIGEILQRIYDSEIHLRFGWLWDAGVDYSIDTLNSVWEDDNATICRTDQGSVVKGLELMVAEVVQRYPDSSVAKWWKQED